jgi:hypothetical protein
VQCEHSGMHPRDYPKVNLGTYMAACLTVRSFFRRNSPNTIVYNQYVNELVQYAVKLCHGVLKENEVLKGIYNNSRLLLPPQLGDIDVIIAGFL